MVNTVRLNLGMLAILASILNPIKSYVYVSKNTLRIYCFSLEITQDSEPCPLSAGYRTSHLKVLYQRSKLKILVKFLRFSLCSSLLTKGWF